MASMPKRWRSFAFLPAIARITWSLSYYCSRSITWRSVGSTHVSIHTRSW
jgi:hypothetical protein